MAAVRTDNLCHVCRTGTADKVSLCCDMLQNRQCIPCTVSLALDLCAILDLCIAQYGHDAAADVEALGLLI